MRTANYSDLRSRLKSYLDNVVTDREPLIVHRPSNNSVVIISLDEYNAIRETAYIASSQEMMNRIKSAEKSIADGNGIKVNINDL